MALLSLKNIELAFGHPPLMESVELQIERGERVCLVGRNGSGKTTLMKIITGEITPDKGEIIKESGIKIAGLSQAVPDRIEGTCFDVIADGLDAHAGTIDEQAHKVDAVISRLDLDAQMPVATMSGGLKRRVLLARALVNEPDLLLLDEPTNHLDIESITWLEQFLLKYEGTLLFVTHDRVFLQKLATRIVDLDNGELTSWPGDFHSYLKKKQDYLEIEEKHNEKFNRKLAEEEAWIRQGIRARRTRNEGRVRDLLKMREIARNRRTRTGAANIQVQQAGRTSKRVVAVEGVGFQYNRAVSIVQDVDVTVYRGDKIGIIGPNGCGKTTLLKLMLGQLEPTSGIVELGENLEIAYLDQLRHKLDDQKTVIENVIDSGDSVLVDGKPRHIISYLQDFLFTPDRAKSPVWVLSGGERNRLLLAKLFTKPSNVLVFDEPTNDLDSETLELLEERVVHYSGTALIVSHDRAFLNNTVTSTLVFEGEGRIGEYVGGYDDWLMQRPVAQAFEKKPQKEKNKREKPKQKRKLTYNETRELEALPRKIEALEAEQEDIHGKMADPEFFKGDQDEIFRITSRVEPLEEELLEAYARWEELETINTGG